MKLRYTWSSNILFFFLIKKNGAVFFLMNLAVIFLNEAITFLYQGLFLYFKFFFNIEYM
jgi:hypothetical protein